MIFVIGVLVGMFFTTLLFASDIVVSRTVDNNPRLKEHYLKIRENLKELGRK